MESLELRDRLPALVAATAILAASFAMLVVPRAASASNEEFCVFANIAPQQACADPNFRKITRVNATSINYSVCAGAFNSNGVEIGGWTCTAANGETSNGNYDGSKFLKGAVLNNDFSRYQTIARGLEYYNP